MALGNQIISARVASATASVGVVDLIVLTDAGFGVEITNVSGSAPLWFTVSHPGGPCPVPVVASASVNASNQYCAGAAAGTRVPVRHAGQFGSVVQLISSGTPEYVVEVTGARVNI